MEALNQRVISLFQQLGDTQYLKSNQTDELFFLNNAIYPNLKERGKACAPCRLRVYNRMLAYYHTIKNG